VVNFFRCPEGLRADVINSLSHYRKSDLTACLCVNVSPREPYFAHPYVLLQTHKLVGRRAELNLLTDWVAKAAAEVYRARVLNVVTIGGVGRSTLTWTWFNDVAPQEGRRLTAEPRGYNPLLSIRSVHVVELLRKRCQL